MDASRELSVGELIEHLLADSLIDAGHITGESVTIVQGTERHSFPYEQARTFLMGMVRGRSWNLTTEEPEGGVERPRSVADREKGSGVVGEPRLDVGRLGVVGEPRSDLGRLDLGRLDVVGDLDASLGSTGPEQISRIDDAPSHRGPVDVETGRVLDDLLAMAVEMGLIASALRDDTSGTVRVELSSCETRMSPDEAIVFVTECILNGLNALRTEVLRQPESGPNFQPIANIVGAQESPHRSASDRPEQRRQARSAGADTTSRGGTVGGRPNWEPLSRCMRTSGIR